METINYQTIYKQRRHQAMNNNDNDDIKIRILKS